MIFKKRSPSLNPFALTLKAPIFNVFFFEDVKEARSLCATTYRGRELLLLIKRRVKIDEVDAV